MGDSDEPKVGGMVLAAGGSSRLGHAKQLVEFKGKTLLRRSAEALHLSECSPAVAVLGADHKRTATELAGLRVTPVINLEWQTGISSSIIRGLNALLAADPDVSAVMITLCDQPFVTTDTINKFLVQYRSRLNSDVSQVSIVAARYDDVLGVPALFSSGLFGSLRDLRGDEGARRIIRDAAAWTIETIDVSEALIDVDSADDVRNLSHYPHS